MARDKVEPSEARNATIHAISSGAPMQPRTEAAPKFFFELAATDLVSANGVASKRPVVSPWVKIGRFGRE
jgi:hypothetical protein